MKIKLIVLLLACITMSGINAQINNVVPGFILSNEGDTLFGYLKERNDVANTKSCLFGETQEGDFNEYGPSDISEYKINDGKYYVAKKFKLGEEQKHIFVEFLVNGIADLYYFRLNDKERYLIEKEGEPIIVIEGEVVKSVDLEANDSLYQRAKKLNGSYIKTSGNFASKSQSQGRIAYLFKEDPAIQQKVRNLQFDQRSMIKLTKNYHNIVCDDYECIVYNKKTDLGKKSIGLFLGTDLGGLVFKTNDTYFRNLVDVEVTRKMRPAFGLTFNATIPYVNSKMFVELILMYSEHYFEYYHISTYETRTKYSYKQTAITGQIGYYLIKKQKFELSPSIGLSGVLIFNGKNDREWIDGYQPGTYKIIPEVPKILFSTNAGIHSSFKVNNKYEIKPAILYEYIYNMDDIALTSNSHVFYFMIGLSKSLNKGEKK